MNIDKRYIDNCVGKAFELFLDYHRDSPLWNTMFSSESQLSAIRFVCRLQQWPSPADKILRALADAAHVIIPSLATEAARLWLFVGDAYGQEPTPIIRYKKMWGRWAENYELKDLNPGPEIGIESDDGLVHYAIVAEVGPENLADALLLVHECQAFMLITPQQLDAEQPTQDLFYAAFAPGHMDFPNRIHWPTLIHQRCLSGDVLIKISGDFEFGEYAVDLIGRKDILDQVQSPQVDEDVSGAGLREFVVDLRGITTYEGFVQAFNEGFCIPVSGHWGGDSWNAFHDYLSWPNEDRYRLRFLGYATCRGLNSQDRAMIDEILTDNPHVIAGFE